ncbi:MAG: hypothetical protein HN353_02415 [Bdellovibrionales bacterium]|jgi:hypothetical protein|nr:hypothetical protein [Bdellovibrionales bacterium]MBT3525540.1 hypothetical protein [Bdellovibrionales bacterium]MBT7670302.1 hypothetical protein [Bdellovibrionales bacterium]MBT7765856.1 hypothetical protein [Bdellovibrionales bacterium]
MRSNTQEPSSSLTKLFDRWNSVLPSWGVIALALFVLVVISGIALIIPYDLNNPDDSLQLIAIFSFEGIFFRSLHYWSATLLLLTTFIHSIEHLSRGHDSRLSWATWLRVVLLILVILFLMITGYILKGDSEGELARTILNGLLATLPWLGRTLQSLLFGIEGYQTIYLHHAATATIIATIFIVEHGRRLWPSTKGWLIAFFTTLLLTLFLPISVFVRQPLLVKGPWYFLGVQELLHWARNPLVVVIAMALPVIILIWLPKMEKGVARWCKISLVTLLPIYLLLSGFALFMRGDGWQLNSFTHLKRYQMFGGISIYQTGKTDRSNNSVPVIRGRREGCINCHHKVTGMVPAHNPKVIGCASCHLGNTLSLVKDVAHQGLVLIPGNLDIAGSTCGTTGCHGEIVNRVTKSLMGTGRGIVRANRKLFGEQVKEHPSLNESLSKLGSSNADNHLRQMCQRCHLEYPKNELGAIDENSRGGGCLACHLNYSPSLNKNAHPSLSIKVSNNHCFGCHSRSGRISTSFEGWHESKLEPTEAISKSINHRLVGKSKRVFIKKHADLHHQAGMSCIDCHTATETMGDGNLYSHQREQLEVACQDCHLKGRANSISWSELTAEDRKILLIRYKRELTERRFLTTKKNGRALINAFVAPSREIRLEGKISRKLHLLKAPGGSCQNSQTGHAALSCSSCHSSWVPQCISCHTQQDKEGRWVEYSGDFLAAPPTLGVKIGNDGLRQIVPVAPGMIMTLNQNRRDLGRSNIDNLSQDGSFHRRFVQVSPHTTIKKGRSCTSCHCSPLALGLGQGVLSKGSEGEWSFTPEYGTLRDGLPADSWTSLFDKKMDDLYMKMPLRPLNQVEQRRVLRYCTK